MNKTHNAEPENRGRGEGASPQKKERTEVRSSHIASRRRTGTQSPIPWSATTLLEPRAGVGHDLALGIGHDHLGIDARAPQAW